MPRTPARLYAGLARRIVRTALVMAAATVAVAALPPTSASAAEAVPAGAAPTDAPPPAAAPAGAVPADAAPPGGTAAPGGTAPPAAAPSTDSSPTERFPEPSLYPTAWELKFAHGTPKRIVVRVTGSQAPRAYWYMTYSVANLGDQEVDFDPVFEMLGDDGRTYRANRAVPGEVFDAIKKKEGNRLLESPRTVAGVVKAGDDQARDSVAIWPEPMLEMGTFTVFAAGLSGEQLMTKNVAGRFVPIDPKKAADELKDVKDEDRLNLRKQYSVTYRVLGDRVSPGGDPIQKRGSQWVMRP